MTYVNSPGIEKSGIINTDRGRFRNINDDAKAVSDNNKKLQE